MATNKSKKPNVKKPTQIARGIKQLRKKKTLMMSNSLLDVMVDGREFESLFNYQFSADMDYTLELRRCLSEIEQIRQHPVVCYIADVLKSKNNTSIEHADDLPFREMIANIPQDKREIDIVLVTPGGLGTQINSFVNVLRPRFDRVSFILLDKAMSAGTMYIMSGDEIIMSKQSRFGPIDPQTRNNKGEMVAEQSLLIALNTIRQRGEDMINKGKNPFWTDIELLHTIDARDIGRALIASQYSIDMVTSFLYYYKFRSWTTHSNGRPVTNQEKETRAARIAKLQCDHSHWKNHGYTINRDVAFGTCKLKITHSETINGLDRAMRRMWAAVFWIFISTPIAKFFLSQNYCITKAG